MTVTVREPRPDRPADLEAFARVRDAAVPFLVRTPASLAHDLAHAHPAAHHRLLLAELDGHPVGTADLGLVHDSTEPGQAYLHLYVDPGHPGHGAGSLLARTAEQRLHALGATRVHSWVLDTPANRAFAEHRGYRASRSAHFLRLDLAHGTLPPAPPVPPGVTLRTAADFTADPRPLFTLDAETSADEPGDVPQELTDYEAWLAQTWQHPLLDRELSSVAVVDGRPAAFSAAHTDGNGRYVTAMTGTARSQRGRGLAKFTKYASLSRAHAAGIQQAFTGNDTGNAPMLAVNKWLGYEICATEVRYVRELG
ncbi:GCN5-related N-acetyltransferase [Actinobacteria bacterium OK074]|nr:GCN5-related N-acetyltransferase [Actinobacteria bacterium OK074]